MRFRAPLVAPYDGRGFRRAFCQLALLGVVLAACQPDDDISGGLGPEEKGTLSVSVSGLPEGSAAAVEVTGTQGYHHNLSGPETIPGVAPGSYTISAADVTVDGDRYAPASPTQHIVVTAGSQPTVAQVAYVLVTGRVQLTVQGVPPGNSVTILLTGPGGYSHTASASELLTGLAPGSYLVQAPTLVIAGDHYAPQTASQQLSVTASTVPQPLTVDYSLASARLVVGVSGLPPGASAAVRVVGPGVDLTLIRTDTLVGLPAGTYSITADNVAAGGFSYVVSPTTVSISLAPGLVPVTAQLSYTPVTGALLLSAAGVPAGVAPAFSIIGPGGSLPEVSGSQLLTGLAPGNYSVLAPTLLAEGQVYLPTPAQQWVTVNPGTTPSLASVSYALVLGSVNLTVSGLPGGAANLSVSGPAGYSQLLTASQLLDGLLAGSYAVSAANVVIAGTTYAPQPASQTIALSPGAAASGTVTYVPITGGLAVTISGVPGGAGAVVTVSGPGGFSQTLTQSLTLMGLVPGVYSIAGAAFTSGGFQYAPSPGNQSAGVTAGATALASVTYAPTDGALSLTIGGTTGGAQPSVSLSGPGGFSHMLTASASLTGLAPGLYTITAATVSNGTYSYAGSPASQTVTVSVGSAASAGVSYAASSGALGVAISGLPGGVGASVTVTGAGGFFQLLTASQTLTTLAPGSYSVTAVSVSSGGTSYAPAPASQSVTVSAGVTAAAVIGYSASGGGASLDLRVDGAYLTQATQRYDGTVPLVAGRDAYLRVFTLANQANTAQPQVRVRLYAGATLLQTYTISAPAAGVPTAADQSALSNSWNLLVPGMLVQPGLRVLADVDPAGAVAEGDETNNQFPLSGIPGNVDVRALPTFALRFVPVLQQVNGLQGNVTDANKESFLGDLKARLPVGAYDADVRLPYTTTAPALESGNGNGGWGTILSEVLALRFAEGAGRYYYGVVKVTYGSGIAGLGYVGGMANSSIGWDHLPSGNNVMAHELGHNMGRWHAPCGGPAGPDPSYPYAGGAIGVWGMDVANGVLKSPSMGDLMSYCHPNWISDYNWSGMVSYRQSGSSSVEGDSGDGLLVWGRITPAGIVLEPAFRVPARSLARPRPGVNRLELLATDGSVLRSLSFEAPEVADLPGGSERQFAFVVPLEGGLGAAVSGLRVRASGRTAQRLAAAGPDPAPQLSRSSSEQVELRWDAARYPMVLVRDAATQQILSFARGGLARVWSRGGDFELQFSDGVRSVARRGMVLR